jgi:integrating conjugative element protein (TIGR03765 family)
MNFRHCLPMSIKLLITLWLLNTLSARASLATISVDGPVYPLKPYFDIKQINTAYVKPTAKLGAANIADMVQFPLATSNLIAGKASTRRVTHPELTQPFFLIGSDAASQDWLSHYAKRLKALHAVGFLVQADTKQDWQKMQLLAHGLPLIPTNGDIFAKRFSVKHYPLLITNNLIEQ